MLTPDIVFSTREGLGYSLVLGLAESDPPLISRFVVKPELPTLRVSQAAVMPAWITQWVFAG
jgi:hypothetical protein